MTDLLSELELRMPILGRVDCCGITFDADALKFTARTNLGGAFVFDVATGKMVGHSSLFPKLIGIAIAGIGMAVVFLLLWIRRERREASTMPSPTDLTNR